LLPEFLLLFLTAFSIWAALSHCFLTLPHCSLHSCCSSDCYLYSFCSSSKLLSFFLLFLIDPPIPAVLPNCSLRSCSSFSLLSPILTLFFISLLSPFRFFPIARSVPAALPHCFLHSCCSAPLLLPPLAQCANK
jgi:hypothetical protein